jgi:hypothetical protein
LWPDDRGNSNGIGNGAGENPFRQFSDEPESGPWQFPGNAGTVQPFTDPFPRAGRLPDAPELPDEAEPPFPDASQLPDEPQLSDTVQFPAASQTPGVPFADEGRSLDDTDPFPTASRPDPRLAFLAR